MAYDPTQGNSDLYFQADLQDNVSPTADQIEKRLKALGASKTEIKMFLTAYDQASPKIKQAQEMVNKLPKQHMINVQTNAEQATKHLQKLREVAKAPVEIVVKVKDNVDDYIRSFKDKFRRLEFEMQQQVQHMPITAALTGIGSQVAGMASGPISSFTGVPVGGLAAGGAAGALGGAGAFFAESVRLNSQMQQNMMQLTQLLRSPSAASSEYQNVANFSNTTPFNMRDVLATDIQLRNQGINPSNRTLGLHSAGNLAAATGVPLSQASGAISSANLGYFQSLNNITGMNIRQSDFTYGGRESGKTYQQAIAQIMQRYTGALQDQTQTFKGLATNIQDAIQQKVIMPAGQSVFGAASGMEKRIAGQVTSPQWQLMMSRETDKVNQGMTKLFQLVQQGGTYFKTSLEAPLKSVGNSIIQVGTAFGKSFGSTTLQGIKYMSQALSTLLVPLGKIAEVKIPFLGTNVGGIMGFMKALQMFGVSTNTGVKDFLGGLTHLDLSKTLTGMREFTSMAGKIGIYLTTKAVLDFKNSTDQLDASFSKFGSKGGDALDGLKIKFDSLIFKANMLGKSVSQVQSYGAEGLTAIGVNPHADPHANVASAIALTAGMNVARMSTFMGSGAAVSGANSAWYKAMNLGNRIYGQHMTPNQASSAVTDVDRQIVQASHALVNALGVTLPRALNMTVTGLQTFYTQLKGAGALNPAGAGLASALQYQLTHGGETVQDYAHFQVGPADVVKSLITQTYAPGASTIGAAMRAGTNARFGGSQALNGNNLYNSWSFLSNRPNAPGGASTAATKTLLDVLGANQGIAASGAHMNTLMQHQFGSMVPGLQLPTFQNPLAAAGYPNLSRSQVTSANPEQQARQLGSFADAGAKAQAKLQLVNKEITQLNNTLQQYSVVQAQAAAAQASFDLHTLPVQEHIQKMQDAMTSFTLSAVNPLQRAMNALGQAMADYQQHQIVPIQRAQDVWNQTMLMTSNRLDDVSNSLRVAQYNMQLYSQGMLVGENAAQKNIESLNIYSEKLQALQLLNNGLQMDITRRQVHGGFSSTVAPMSGFSLAREQQMASNRAQLAQIQYDTTYGEKHWELQRAARTIFQSRELPFSQRMRGTLAAAATTSSGEIATFALQNLQYQESLKSRKLEEQMYTAQKGTWGMQDKQYALNKQMFEVQQRMSINSDKVARAQLDLQKKSEKIQWNTQKINDLVQIAENGPKGAQTKLYGLDALAGALQNLPADVNNIEGGLIKNFDNNVKKGNTALVDHLPQIARDMGVSAVMLKDIDKLLGGSGQGGGGGGGSYNPSHTGGGLGGGGSVLNKGWNLLTGIVTAPLTTLITAANAAANLAHQFTGSGTLGTAAGIATGVGGGLFALNAARIAAGQFVGRAVLPGLGHVVGGSAEEGWRHSLGGFLTRRGATAVEGAGGHGMDIVKSLLRPMAYLWTKLAQFGTITAVSGAAGAVVPGVGHAIGLPLGWMAGEQAEAAVQGRLIHSKPFPVLRSIARGHPLHDFLEIVKETAGGTSSKTKSVYEKFAASDGKTMRVVIIDPERAGAPDGAKFASNSFWSTKSGIPTPAGTASHESTRINQQVTDQSNLKPGTTEADRAAKEAASSQRASSKTFKEVVGDLKSKVAPMFQRAASSETATAIKNTGAAKKAEEAASVLRDGSGTFKDIIKGKWADLIKEFGTHIGRFGKAGALIGGAAVVFENAGAAFKDAASIISAGAKDISTAFGDLKRWVKSLVPHIHTPNLSKDSKFLGDAAEAGKLDEEISKNPALRAALQKAAKAGSKVLTIGGKVFNIGSKVLGGLSFLPAGEEALKGNYGKAALDAAKAGEYFVPGVGNAKALQDLAGLIGIKPGSTAGVGPHGGIPNLPGVNPGQSPGDKIVSQIFAGITGGDGSVQLPSISQMKALSAQFRGLSKQEQQAFYEMSKKQQITAYQDALTGPNGLKDYLDSYMNQMQTGYTNQMATQHQALVQQSQKLAGHLNAVQGAFGQHWTSVGTITSTGFDNIGKLSGKYLQSLSKQIQGWGKANGLHITENAQVMPGNTSFGGAQILNGSSVVINQAHGGLVHADKHRVGMDRGRMVRMVEEGHPEVVIPLAPHRRDRAKSLVKSAAGMLGMAGGGYVFPFPKGEGFQWMRVDQGQDLQGPAGGPVLAIAPGIVSKAADKFSGFGPFYATEQITGGPLRGRGVYYGHTRAVKTGPVNAGDVIAYTQTKANDWTAAPAGWLELGFLPYGSMSAGAAIAPILHALAKGGDFTAGVGGAIASAAGATAMSHLQLHNAPGALKSLGIMGPKAHAALRVMAHKVQSHYNKMGAPAGSTSMLGTGGIAPGSWMKVVQQLAKRMGWGASEINAWKGVEQAEDSSYSLTATNSGSGAYGLAQMLGNVPGVAAAKQKYYTYGGNPDTLVGQLTGMANYIKQRYGTPSAALAHENAFHWYAGGLPRVSRDGTLAMLHQGETVLSAAQTNSGAASGAVESQRILKQIADNTGGTNTYLGKQLAIQEQAYVASIKATGPNGHGTGSLIGAKYNSHLINTAGGRKSVFGSAADQTSNLVTSLIGSLHNTPVAETIIKPGRAHSYTLNTKTDKLVESKGKVSDAKAYAIDSKTLKEIDKKIADLRDKMSHEKKGSAAYKKDNKQLTQLEKDAAEIKKEMSKISTTLHMSLAKALETRTKDQKAVQVDKTQIARLEKALKGHHLTAAQRKTDNKELAADKKKESGDVAALNNLNKALNPALQKWIKMEEKKGVSKKAIDLAIKNVGKGDNQSILSDKQLHGKVIGQYTGGSKVHGKQLHSGASTGKHHQKGHTSEKDLKDVAKNTKEGAKHGSKTASTVQKHLATAHKHLTVATKHASTAAKHLSATNKGNATANKHLSVANKHLTTASKTDKTVSKHLTVGQAQQKSLEKSLSSAVSRQKTAENHLSISKDHNSKAEKASATAEKDRKQNNKDNDTAHKDAGTFHKSSGGHQTRIETQFGQMINHLSNVANKLDKINPNVQNNITIQIDKNLKASMSSVGQGSVRTR